MKRVVTIQDISCVGKCSLTVALPGISACGVETAVIPTAVLSGGQYDSMMKKMKRRSGAIGFAVYLDILEQYAPAETEYDIDTLLVYDDSCSISEIEAKAKQLTGSGQSILLQRQIPPGIRCRQIVTMEKGGAE